MKLILAATLFLVLLPFVSAISAGSNITIYDGDCVRTQLFVNANLTIDVNETFVSENCLLNASGSNFEFYNCTCESPIVVSTNVLAINNYSITAEVWKSKDVVETIPPKDGGNRDGGKGGGIFWQYKDDTNKSVNKTIPVPEEPLDIIVEEELVEQPVVESEEDDIITEENDGWFKWWCVWMVLSIGLVAVGCYVYYKRV